MGNLSQFQSWWICLVIVERYAHRHECRSNKSKGYSCLSQNNNSTEGKKKQELSPTRDKSQLIPTLQMSKIEEWEKCKILDWQKNWSQTKEKKRVSCTTKLFPNFVTINWLILVQLNWTFWVEGSLKGCECGWREAPHKQLNRVFGWAYHISNLVLSITAAIRDIIYRLADKSWW